MPTLRFVVPGVVVISQRRHAGPILASAAPETIFWWMGFGMIFLSMEPCRAADIMRMTIEGD